jgi:hypothetical protein
MFVIMEDFPVMKKKRKYLIIAKSREVQGKRKSLGRILGGGRGREPGRIAPDFRIETNREKPT